MAEQTVEKLTEVNGPDDKGYSTAKWGVEDVEFGRVPQPPFWRTGPQGVYHVQRCWFLRFTKGDRSRKIYIFEKQLEKGATVDLDKCHAEHDESEFAL